MNKLLIPFFAEEGSSGGGNPTMFIILGAIIVVVIVFLIISSVTGKKAQKREQSKRKKIVRDEIKLYLAKEKDLKNVQVEFEKVYARRGQEYKYRDVFDVIVNIFEAKNKKILYTKAYEIEGTTTKISKKEFRTEWIVNSEIDLEDTRHRIAVAEKKIKLSKEERQLLKFKEKEFMKVEKEKEKENIKKIKSEKKVKKGPTENDEKAKLLKKTTVKFVPKRK